MTGDYVSLYMNTAFAQNDLTPVLSLMFLFMGRMLPIITLVPFFGGKILPRPVKVALAFSLFAIFLPQLMAGTKTALGFNMELVLYLFKEMFIGLLIGFFLSIPFLIVQNTGVLIDHQRGASSLMVNDPTIQTQSSPLGTLYNYVLIFLFFAIDGQFMVLDIISESYTLIPPDQLLDSSIFNNSTQFIEYTTKLLGRVMILSTQLAAPALIMVLMTDFFLGVANRLAPQVQITFLGMPLKSLLALAIIFFGWSLFTQEILSETYKSLRFLALLIQQLHAAGAH